MNVLEALRIALRGLRAHRLRAVLTTLGIVIGVASVIVLVALGNGLQDKFSQEFGALATQITVTKTQGSTPGVGKARKLTNADVTALRDHTRAPDIVSITPVITGTALARGAASAATFRVAVTGTTPDYLSVANRRLLVGSFFTDEHFHAKARVVVFGPEAAANLFGGDVEQVLGKRVRIGRAQFTVIGVVKSNGEQDNAAIMPFGAARAHLIGGNEVNQITAKASGTQAVDLAVQQATKILTFRHHIRDPAKRDFEAKALGSLLEESSKFFTYLTLFMVAVAAISLVVGGIGVANIMLVSVTERTREIGIRKAIGAQRGAILKQFLIEAITLASLGGIMGILVGVGLSLTAAEVLPTIGDDLPAPRISTESIAVSFTISAAIGVLAGGYPAYRAARLRPIDALRYE